MEAFLSPRDLALAIGVSESSLKRWVDSGALVAVKTEGGHRRIPLAEAVRFVRARRAVVVRPDLLGLPDVSKAALATAADDGDGERLEAALVADDVGTARGLILASYLQGSGVAALFDGPLQKALARIGELWRSDEAGIVTEHRATDTCIQALQVLRSLIPEPAPSAPVALTAALAGDPYLLPPLLAAIVTAEAGFRARNLGPETPVKSLARAILAARPRLVCIALSAPRKAEPLATLLAPVLEALGGTDTHLVIGGRLADARDLPEAPGVSHAATMAELAAFARGLRAPRRVTSGRSRSARGDRRPRT